MPAYVNANLVIEERLSCSKCWFWSFSTNIGRFLPFIWLFGWEIVIYDCKMVLYYSKSNFQQYGARTDIINRASFGESRLIRIRICFKIKQIIARKCKAKTFDGVICFCVQQEKWLVPTVEVVIIMIERG